MMVPHQTDAPRRRLLIVDDESDIVSMLDAYFTGEGYDTVCAGSAAEVLALVNEAAAHAAKATGQTTLATGAGQPALAPTASLPRAGGIDLVLLDVNLSGMDGFELCRRIREHLACPIIFLTARVEDADQLDGFAAGGDDYVLKPFSLAVLGGRVRAHLAREARHGAEEHERSTRVFSNITVDFAERTVTVASATAVAPGESGSMGEPGSTPSPTPLDLTRTEFDIIALLSKNPGRVYDRTQIYERVWNWDATGDPAIVREHVRRIRNKFAAAGAGDDVIETVWGVGYRWVAR